MSWFKLSPLSKHTRMDIEFINIFFIDSQICNATQRTLLRKVSEYAAKVLIIIYNAVKSATIFHTVYHCADDFDMRKSPVSSVTLERRWRHTLLETRASAARLCCVFIHIKKKQDGRVNKISLHGEEIKCDSRSSSRESRTPGGWKEDKRLLGGGRRNTIVKQFLIYLRRLLSIRKPVYKGALFSTFDTILQYLKRATADGRTFARGNVKFGTI